MKHGSYLMGSPIQIFLDVPGNERLLTAEEEIALAERRDAGDMKARDELVTRNLLIAVRVARHYLKATNSEFDDLLAEANYGLMLAANAFDPARKKRFSTCAGWYIQQQILKYFSQKRNLIRLPSDIQAIRYNVATGKPLNEEQKRLMEVRGDQITAKCTTFSCGSGDGEIDIEEIRDRESDMDSDEVDWVRNTLDLIPKKKGDLLRSRFGIDGNEMTFREIGDKQGVTREAVRQQQVGALMAMSDHLKDSMVGRCKKKLYPIGSKNPAYYR